MGRGEGGGRVQAVDAATLWRLYVLEDRPMAELAVMFRVGTATVRRWLREADIPARSRAEAGHRRLLAPAPATELGRLLDEGLSVPGIARHLEVSSTTAARWLREAGFELPASSLRNRPRGGDRPITPSATGELRRLYAGEGLSMAGVADRLGVSTHLVRTWLAEAGIPSRPAGGRAGVARPRAWRKPVPPADELRTLLLEQQLGRRELAERYGVHPSTVSRWLTEAGLPTRPPPAGTLTAAEMVALYQQEAIPAAEVARRAGVPESRVLRALQRAGVPVDRQRQVAAVRAAAARRAAQPLLPPADGDWAEARYRFDGWSHRRIGEALSVTRERVSRELRRRQVPVRARPVPGRASRTEAPVQQVQRLYVESELPADDVGGRLDVAGPIVLRTGHSHGLPIRPGGRATVRAAIELIDGLYVDPAIAAVLDRYQVPRVPPGGGIAERFPEPVPLTHELLRDLYTEAGCSTPQIELLTGQSQVVVRDWMRRWQIPLREEHLPPALLRLRAAARQRFLAEILRSYCELGSTSRVAAAYGVTPETVRRWLLAAGGQVPGRGRWSRQPHSSPDTSSSTGNVCH